MFGILSGERTGGEGCVSYQVPKKDPWKEVSKRRTGTPTGTRSPAISDAMMKTCLRDTHFGAFLCTRVIMASDVMRRAVSFVSCPSQVALVINRAGLFHNNTLRTQFS